MLKLKVKLIPPHVASSKEFGKLQDDLISCMQNAVVIFRQQNISITPAPFSISPEDFQSLREELAQFIKRFVNKVNATDPSEMAVLNIDLLKLK